MSIRSKVIIDQKLVVGRVKIIRDVVAQYFEICDFRISARRRIELYEQCEITRIQH